MISISGRDSIEVEARIKKARGARHRLTTRLWLSKVMLLKLKARAWVVLVRSVIFHALVVRRISPGGLKRLERFQISCLRHLARSPYRPFRAPYDDIRERCGARSLESTLLVRRRLRVQKVIALVFLS